MSKETDDIFNELQEIEVINAQLREERKILLENLGWYGMTDEEVTWICKHKEVERNYKLTLDHIRQLIANEKEIKNLTKNTSKSFN